MDESKARFRGACDWLLSVEGGFVDDPDDRGGPTKFGLSQRAHPFLDVSSLTQEQAEAIYWADYWQRARCGRLPPTLGFALFDSAVQHGPERAVKLLQEVLRVRVDGINGPVTQAAAHRMAIGYTLPRLLTVRALFYHQVTLADSTQARFIRGWLRRLFELQQAALEEVLDA